MQKVNVHLQPIVININLPTVLKTAILPGDSIERLFIATQVGEIFYIGNGVIETFLDIRSQILELGSSTGGYDERGLLGLAFHPEFNNNGLFYLHYSVAGTQGPGALSGSFHPNPCDPGSQIIKWINRETQYNHIDTVEEWILRPNNPPHRRRTLLNIKRPFLNHNGVNSLNFSPETGKLILTTGDGGSGYDPFNLSQDDLEIAGKIIEMDVDKNIYTNTPPIVTRFDELPVPIQVTLTVLAKGVRNVSGISFQKLNNQYIKYIGNVGQDLEESIYAFITYKPIPVTQLVQTSLMSSESDKDGLINLGWRGWEGSFPTPIMKSCTTNSISNEKTIAYYDEAVRTSTSRLWPLTSYFHEDPRSDKLGGTALTGVKPYLGDEIPELTGKVLFIDFARNDKSLAQARGFLAYTQIRENCKVNDFSVIETDYNFESKSAYYVALGTNLAQNKLYLGVYGSSNVTDFNQGTIFEIIP